MEHLKLPGLSPSTAGIWKESMENCPEILKVCIYFLVFLALGLEPARFYIYSRAGSFQQKTQTFSKKNGVFNRCRVFFFLHLKFWFRWFYGCFKWGMMRFEALPPPKATAGTEVRFSDKEKMGKLSDAKMRGETFWVDEVSGVYMCMYLCTYILNVFIYIYILGGGFKNLLFF